MYEISAMKDELTSERHGQETTVEVLRSELESHKESIKFLVEEKSSVEQKWGKTKEELDQKQGEKNCYSAKKNDTKLKAYTIKVLKSKQWIMQYFIL